MRVDRPQRPATILGVVSAIVAVVAAGAVRADIYTFVDERGIAHFTNVPLDHRYYLYKKDRSSTAPPGSNIVLTSVAAPRLQRKSPYDSPGRRQLAPLVAAVAEEHGLEAALLHAIVTVESGYDPLARSAKGATGLMQLMPETALRYGVGSILDPRENLRGGARYLRDLLETFNGNLSLVLAAYNAGETSVIRHGYRIPPYPETRNYVPRVLQHYHLYRTATRPPMGAELRQ
jgi:soluble lytic murein transglycosylase-like protein